VILGLLTNHDYPITKKQPLIVLPVAEKNVTVKIPLERRTGQQKKKNAAKLEKMRSKRL
jgi:hypothetical protein